MATHCQHHADALLFELETTFDRCVLKKLGPLALLKAFTEDVTHKSPHISQLAPDQLQKIKGDVFILPALLNSFQYLNGHHEEVQ